MKLTTKFLLLTLVFGFVLMTSKVQGQAAVGGGLAFGTEIESVGINVNGTYMITDNIALAPSLIYWIPKSYFADYKLKWFEVDLNGHYYFDAGGNVKPYALAGLNFSFITVPVLDWTGGWLGGGSFTTKNSTTTKVGLNLGGGVEFDIDAPIKPFGQINYTIIDSFDQLVIMAGVRFPLN